MIFLIFNSNLTLPNKQYAVHLRVTMKGKNIIKKLLTQCICGILLLQMINVSIAPSNVHPSNFNGFTNNATPSYNGIANMYHLTLEQLFDKEIPANNNDDDSSTHAEISEFYFNSTCDIKSIIDNFPLNYSQPFQPDVYLQYAEPNGPPPKKG